MAEIKKPVRVVTGTVHLFTCPVCRDDVFGTVKVEAHLGDLSMHVLGGDDTTVGVQPTLPVVTKTRSMRVTHDCRPAVEAEDPMPCGEENPEGDLGCLHHRGHLGAHSWEDQ